MKYRLSRYTALEVTAEKKSVAMNIEPKLYVYETNTSRPQRTIELFTTDGYTQSRIHGYSSINNNVLLNPTPNFYYDYMLGTAGWHNTRRADVLISGANAQVQYIKYRLLFADGFQYDTLSTIATTLRIFQETADRTVDLLAFVDIFDQSSIVPMAQQIFESQQFTACIEFWVLDTNYLNISTDSDIIALREAIYGSGDVPTSIKVESAYIDHEDIYTFYAGGYAFRRIIFGEVSSISFDTTLSDSGIYMKVVNNGNGNLSFNLDHTELSITDYLTRLLEEPQCFYDILISYYSISDTLVGTQAYRLANNLSTFTPCNYRLGKVSGSHYAVVTISGIAASSNMPMRIEREAVITVDTETLAVDLSNLTLTVTKVVNKVSPVNGSVPSISSVALPSVVYVNKPTYIFSQSAGTINITPYKQTIAITLPTGVSSSFAADALPNKLAIGNNTYTSNVDGLTFTLDVTAYYTKSDNWFLLSKDDQLITSGKITRLI